MTRNRKLGTITTLIAAAGLTACTQQLEDSFRLEQQEEVFSSQLEINTMIDMLWVVDNSASMDVSQEKLRAGFKQFAQKYLQPTWDIRVAVITTDTYLAHTGFDTYRNQVVAGTKGWKSPHINSRLGTWVNPSWSPNLVNTSTGAFDNGVKIREMVPAWTGQFSRLLPGLHDGPITALCFEGLPYFMDGVTQCAVRDDQTRATGPAKCLNPNTTAGETSLVECVNTVQNDTVRSGRAIINTMPPAGVKGDAAWTNALINDFMVNVTAGSAGHGSERGLGSLLQMLNDNEATDTAFFRPQSVRAVIFVSDEEDQTVMVDAGVTHPWNYYKCDQAGLLSMNSSAKITGTNGYCCSDPAKNCFLGSEGTSCTAKTIDGYTYTPSICAREDKLVPVADVKSALDLFFNTLDGAEAGTNPNYFVTSIVPMTAKAIQDLQAARAATDASVGAVVTHAVDRGDRYLALGKLVGNGSLEMNIADEDYSPILEAIGNAIIEKKGKFILNKVPTGEEEMLVYVKHKDGSKDLIPADKYVISGNVLTITDLNLILGFESTDSIAINYQPKTIL